MRYAIYVNGKAKYKNTMTLRKAKLKAEWLRGKGYTFVEIVEEGKGSGLNKFGAIRTEVDGISFDSRAEANYYVELCILQRVNVVKQIQLKPRYTLLKPYHHPTTRKVVRGIEYVADFHVTYASGREEVVDVKSKATRTPVYRLKKKLFESQYGIEIVEVER